MRRLVVSVRQLRDRLQDARQAASAVDAYTADLEAVDPYLIDEQDLEYQAEYTRMGMVQIRRKARQAGK